MFFCGFTAYGSFELSLPVIQESQPFARSSPGFVGEIVRGAREGVNGRNVRTHPRR